MRLEERDEDGKLKYTPEEVHKQLGYKGSNTKRDLENAMNLVQMDAIEKRFEALMPFVDPPTSESFNCVIAELQSAGFTDAEIVAAAGYQPGHTQRDLEAMMFGTPGRTTEDVEARYRALVKLADTYSDRTAVALVQRLRSLNLEDGQLAEHMGFEKGHGAERVDCFVRGTTKEDLQGKYCKLRDLERQTVTADVIQPFKPKGVTKEEETSKTQKEEPTQKK